MINKIQFLPNYGSNTENRKRINLNVIGKSGATTVVASFRTDDNADAIVATTAATINFFIIYSVGCEKPRKIAKIALIIR
jgi:hypothetical protein